MKKIQNFFSGFLIIFSLFFVFHSAEAGFFDWFFRFFGKNEANVKKEEIVLPKYYRLGVSSVGSGTVIINVNEGKINCGNECRKIFPEKSLVELTAKPNDNYIFKSWSGCDYTPNEKCKIEMNKNVTITANFAKKENVVNSQQQSGSHSSKIISSSVSQKSSSKSSLVSSKTNNSKLSNSLSSAASSKAPSSRSSSSSSIFSAELMEDVFLMDDDGTLIDSDNKLIDKKIVEKFYTLHPQKTYYDFLSVFPSFEPGFQGAFHSIVKNDVKGIGGPQITSSYLSDSNKLIGVNFLGFGFTSPRIKTEDDVKNNLHYLVHETGHQWLAYIGKEEGFSTATHYTNWTDTGFIRDGQQWSDVMGGSPWKDNGDGTVSEIITNKQGFSKLSLYLMGLASQTEVPDLRIVVPENPQDQSPFNVHVRGEPKTISISDIVSRYGTRIPSYQTSQKDFKMAYILLSKKSNPPTMSQIDAINYVAKYFPSEWNFVTYGKSTINSR
ncbi:MAG: hypothetical protein HUT38_00385 [Candidatus Paceibacter sp.]|nr:hypothetical protein [Candidatus Paceibacter sp.]